MKFQKGQSGNPRGRPKGTPNPLTRAFREAVMTVYHGLGGDAAFLEWAQANPSDFYRICARLIPQEVAVNANVTPLVIDMVTEGDIAQSRADHLELTSGGMP